MLPNEPKGLYVIDGNLIEIVEARCRLNGIELNEFIKRSIRIGKLLYYAVRNKGYSIIMQDHLQNTVASINWFAKLPISQIKKPIAEVDSGKNPYRVSLLHDLNTELAGFANDLSYSVQEILELFIHEYLYIIELVEEGGQVLIDQGDTLIPIDLHNIINGNHNSEG